MTGCHIVGQYRRLYLCIRGNRYPVVTDFPSIVGVFNIEPRDFDKFLKEECIEVDISSAKIHPLSSTGRPTGKSKVYFDNVEKFCYNYDRLRQLVSAVSGISGHGAKYGLKRGSFYVHKETGVIFFTIDYYVGGALAPYIKEEYLEEYARSDDSKEEKKNKIFIEQNKE